MLVKNNSKQLMLKWFRFNKSKLCLQRVCFFQTDVLAWVCSPWGMTSGLWVSSFYLDYEFVKTDIHHLDPLLIMSSSLSHLNSSYNKPQILWYASLWWLDHRRSVLLWSKTCLFFGQQFLNLGQFRITLSMILLWWLLSSSLTVGCAVIVNPGLDRLGMLFLCCVCIMSFQWA